MVVFHTGPLSSVDWVAGGNYDGFVYRYVLSINGEKAELIREILHHKRYDGRIQGNRLTGSVDNSDARATVINFGREDGMHLRLRRLENGATVYLSGNILYNAPRFGRTITFMKVK